MFMFVCGIASVLAIEVLLVLATGICLAIRKNESKGE